MKKRSSFDISSYLIVGPENTHGRPVADIVRVALSSGFTCLQLRSKVATARDMLALTRACADVRAELGRADRVALLIDDRFSQEVYQKLMPPWWGGGITVRNAEEIERRTKAFWDQGSSR